MRATLWGQRILPGPVRAAVRGMVRRPAVGAPQIDDWRAPLVPDRGAGLPAGLCEPVPAAPLPAVRVRERSLRCAVATGVLDAGGLDEFVAFLGRRLPGEGVATTVVYTGERIDGYQGGGGRLAKVLAAEAVPMAKLSPADGVGWLSAHRPDVISAHGAPDWLLGAANTLGVPWVETLHGMHSFFDRAGREREAARAPGVTAQIAVSELVRQQYLGYFPGYPADRIVTIPNGIDSGRVTATDRDSVREAFGLRDEFVFLSLARHCLQKNTYGLVMAFAEVARRHPEAHLIIAGRADDALYFEQVRRAWQALPCADRIHLREHCPNPSVLLAAADAFVLDSFFEGWPLSSMEAITSGLPAVLSDVGGAAEQLGPDGRRGHLVANPAPDARRIDWPVMTKLRFAVQPNKDELVAAMSSLVRDRRAWAAARPRLRAEATGLFPMELCLSRHADVLRSMAAQGVPQ
jgi:glycosyltransferase involved in cell wall biosynthesis